jgi:thioredoxin reductase (NADPH)
MEDAIIVGSGPVGLACAVSAKRRGLDPLVVDQGSVCDSIVRYPIRVRCATRSCATRLE